MLVSAICPTTGRVEMLRRAIACFAAQTYPDKQLIVVDDEERNLDELGGVPYVYIASGPLSVATKRNLACAHADGDVIVHWDDDDYSAPGRIADQVTRLQQSGAPLTGYNAMVFFDHANRRAWKYKGDRHYALGTSLCYPRSTWERSPFPDFRSGEDNWMVAQYRLALAAVDANCLMYATIHPNNTCPRGLSSISYQPIDYDATLRQFHQ